MYDYIVRGLSGTVPCGSIVVLNAEQVRRRFHNLRPADGENTYITTNAIIFKRGEEFSCNLDLTKQQLGAIKLVGGGPDESEAAAVEQEAEATAEATAEADTGEAAEVADQAAGDDTGDYASATREDLKAECELRGIVHANNTPTAKLIDLLIADDCSSAGIDDSAA